MSSSRVLRSVSILFALLLIVAAGGCKSRRARGGGTARDLGPRDDAGELDASASDLGGEVDLGGDVDLGRVDLGPGGPDGELRLSGGSSGTLEVYYMGQWGTVCDDLFDDVAAGVACRQLGYATGTWMSAATPGTGEIFMDDIQCTGTELRLDQCTFGGFGVHNCSHGEDVALTCSAGAP